MTGRAVRHSRGLLAGIQQYINTWASEIGGVITIMKRQPVVYILASSRNGTLYIGVTSNLVERVWQHKSDHVDGFSKKYQTHLLVYIELFTSMRAAILREKQLKKWNRKWKLKLIEDSNPDWRDLYDELVK
jgi:putative endonuclease